MARERKDLMDYNIAYFLTKWRLLYNINTKFVQDYNYLFYTQNLRFSIIC